MSEFSLSSTTTKKKNHFSSRLLTEFFLFCSFILSHPLYFSYFVFFSPYLLKLLSFLSPLFITTSLLLLALLTVSPNLVHDNCSRIDDQLSESKVSFVISAYQAVVERLRSKVEDGYEEVHSFEGFDAYKIVFEALNLNFGENSVDDLELEAKENCLATAKAEVQQSMSSVNAGGGVISNVSEALINGDLDEKSVVVVTRPETSEVIAEVKTTLGGFLHQKEEFEDLWCEKEVKEVKPLSVNSNKVEEQQQNEESITMTAGSKAVGHKISEAKVGIDDDDNAGYYTPKQNSLRLEGNFWSPDHGDHQGKSTTTTTPPPKVTENSQSNLGSFGSMRKEKEWRRTLACKLFEERHNVDGGEGMDLLWETYDQSDSIKVQPKRKTKRGKKGSNVNNEDYGDDDDDEEEGNDGHLCCLQALKFSAGKMNLGMGRPNLVKISKALKGIGWLHHVSRSGKKGYH